MFQESPHKEAFDSKGLHECGVCHNNHNIVKPTDEMLGTGDKSVCIKCHKDNDEGFKTAFRMKFMIDSLIKDVDLANYFINEAEQKGMDVSDAKFDYNDIKKVLITSRTVTHYSSLEKYINTINDGFKITTCAKQPEKKQLANIIPGVGLGVSAFITILGWSYLKLRKVKKQKKTLDYFLSLIYRY
jgi:predicted CXXCH cytochrome family protein